LVGAAVLLTRYAGLTLLVTGVIVLLASPARLTTKLMRSALFASVVLAPVAVWTVRNAMVGDGPVGNRQLTWHAVSQAHLLQGLFTVLDWIIPSSIVSRIINPNGGTSWEGIALVTALLIGLGWWARNERRTALPMESASLRGVLVTFSFIYPVC